MLLEFSEEDRETFKDMSYQQLKVVHNKQLRNMVCKINIKLSFLLRKYHLHRLPFVSLLDYIVKRLHLFSFKTPISQVM